MQLFYIQNHTGWTEMIAQNINEEKNSELGYGQILAILWRNRFLFAGVLAAVLALSMVMTLRKAPTYQSTMQLLVEPNYPGGKDPLPEAVGSSSEQSSSSSSSQDYATQINLMRSNFFIEKLVKELKPEYSDLSVDEIRNSLTLEKVIEGKESTKILKATFTSNSPIKTQKVLNALQVIYQNYNQQQQKLRLTGGIRFVDGQLQIARMNVDQTQNKIESFRKKYGLFDPNQQVIFITNSLNQLDQELRTVQTQRKELQSRYAVLQQQLNLSQKSGLIAARLTQSTRYQRQLDNIKETEQELAKKRSVVTDDNPIIKNLLDQRQKQLELLRQETTQVLGSSAANLNTSGENLLSNGQLSPIDLTVVNNLAEIRVNLEGLNARATKLSSTRQELRKQLNLFPTLIAEYDRLQPEVELGRSVVKKLLEQRQEISSRLSRGGFTWQLVEPPILGYQTGPDHKKDVLLGLVVGMFLAGGSVFLLEAFNKIERPSKGVAFKHELPLLGTLPAISFSELKKSLDIKSFQDSKFASSSLVQTLDISEFRDSIDSIFKNIKLHDPQLRLKSLAVTSAIAGEGKTIFVLGLALSIARSNLRVLVIDADLQYSSLDKHLGLENNQGLADLLTDEALLPMPVQVSLFGSNIDILTFGSTSESFNYIDLMSSKRMKELMSIFTSHYDLVLLDTSPVLSMPGTAQILSLCSSTVLVLQPDRLNQADLSKAIEVSKDITLLGIVKNEFSSTSLLSTNSENNNGDQLSREFLSWLMPKDVSSIN
jgi:polysaccharide biosynthesis transport protein